MKNVLIISTSPRRGGNSEILCEEFAKGVVAAGNAVETISLIDKTIGFCRGCFECQKTHKCVIDDDMDAINEKIKNADAVVFATPIYYYEMSGQLKTLLDRTNPLYQTDYMFRDVYLIATCADGDDTAVNTALDGIHGWIVCFPAAQFAGVLRGTWAKDAGEIRDNRIAMRAAFEMGKIVG